MRAIAALVASWGFTEPGEYERDGDLITVWRGEDGELHASISYGEARRKAPSQFNDKEKP